MRRWMWRPPPRRTAPKHQLQRPFTSTSGAFAQPEICRQKIFSGFRPGSIALVLQQMCKIPVGSEVRMEPAGGASLSAFTLYLELAAEHESDLSISKADTPQHPQQA